MSSSFRAVITVFVASVLSSMSSQDRRGPFSSADFCKEATVFSYSVAISFSVVISDVNPLAEEYISLIVDVVFNPKSINWTMLLASPNAARASAIVKSRA